MLLFPILLMLLNVPTEHFSEKMVCSIEPQTNNIICSLVWTSKFISQTWNKIFLTTWYMSPHYLMVEAASVVERGVQEEQQGEVVEDA